MIKGYISPLVINTTEPLVPSIAQAVASYGSEGASKAKKEKGEGKEPKVDYKGTHAELANSHDAAMKHLETISRLQTMYSGLDYKYDPEYKASEKVIDEMMSPSYNALAESHNKLVILIDKRITGKDENGISSGDNVTNDYSLDYLLKHGEVKTFGSIFEPAKKLGHASKVEAYLRTSGLEDLTFAGTATFTNYVNKAIKEAGVDVGKGEKFGGYVANSLGGEISIGDKDFKKIVRTKSQEGLSNLSQADKAYFKIIDDMINTPEVKNGLFSNYVQENKNAFVPAGTKYKGVDIAGKNVETEYKPITESINADNMQKYFKWEDTDKSVKMKHGTTAEKSGMGYWKLKDGFTLKNADGTVNQQALEIQLKSFGEYKVGEAINIQRTEQKFGGEKTWSLQEIEQNITSSFMENLNTASPEKTYTLGNNNRANLVGGNVTNPDGTTTWSQGSLYYYDNNGQRIPTKEGNLLVNAIQAAAKGEGVGQSSEGKKVELIQGYLNNMLNGNFDKWNNVKDGRYKDLATKIKSGSTDPEVYREFMEVATKANVIHQDKQDMNANRRMANDLGNAIVQTANYRKEQYLESINNKVAKIKNGENVQLSESEKKFASEYATVEVPWIGSDHEDDKQITVSHTAYAPVPEVQAPMLAAINNQVGENGSITPEMFKESVINGVKINLANVGMQFSKFDKITDFVVTLPMNDPEYKRALAQRAEMLSLVRQAKTKQDKLKLLSLMKSNDGKIATLFSGRATIPASQMQAWLDNNQIAIQDNSAYNEAEKNKFRNTPEYQEILKSKMNENSKGSYNPLIGAYDYRGNANAQSLADLEYMKKYPSLGTGGPTTPKGYMKKVPMSHNAEVEQDGFKYNKAAILALRPTLIKGDPNKGIPDKVEVNVDVPFSAGVNSSLYSNTTGGTNLFAKGTKR